MEISLGRIVHYKLTATDATQINKRRADYSTADKSVDTGFIGHVGNSVAEGDVYPFIVTKVWSDGHGVNGQVMLDGNDLFWATSRIEGEEPGNWFWPPKIEAVKE